MPRGFGGVHKQRRRLDRRRRWLGFAGGGSTGAGVPLHGFVLRNRRARWRGGWDLRLGNRRGLSFEFRDLSFEF